MQAWLIHTLEQLQGLGPLGWLGYIGLYVLACLTFLPGSILTLGSGVIYGFWWGTLLTSIANTTGATVCFLISRFLARDWMTRKLQHNEKFIALDGAVKQEGWKIVLLSRLSPIFPFSVINYGLGLTRIPLLHFIFASWAGVLPLTAVYVYVGSLVGTSVMSEKNPLAGTPWDLAVKIGGLIATVAVSVFVTRLATKALNEKLKKS